MPTSNNQHVAVSDEAKAQFDTWDFVKMLCMAALCGFVVSLAVAGITLLLAPSAEQQGASGPLTPVSLEAGDKTPYQNAIETRQVPNDVLIQQDAAGQLESTAARSPSGFI